MKVGFIGLGHMGAALAEAVAGVAQVELLLSNHNPQKAGALQQRLGGCLLSNAAIVEQADVIFLGVKPHQVYPLLQELLAHPQSNPSAIWVSLAAGIQLADLAKIVPAEHLVRIMPNTPVAVGEGMTTYALTNQEWAPLIEELLAGSGLVQQVPERLLDAATAIAGCGPAFVYQFIEALMDAGIQQGLPAQEAKVLAAQTLSGTAQLLLQSKKHPAELRQEVTSPGGATIAGVVALEKAGFRHAVMTAVSKAFKRTKQLGKENRS